MNIFFFVICVLIILFEVYPLFKRKFYKEKCLKFNGIRDIEAKVSNASIEMVNSSRTKMSFDDDGSLYARLSRLKKQLLFDKKHYEYRYYNFPRAWLYLGVIEQYKKSQKQKLLSSLISKSDRLIDANGCLKFCFDKIDQSLFGVVFIELYYLTSDQRFKKAAEEIYQEVQKFINNDGLILYRRNLNVCFVDTLGMVLPFLYTYSDLFKEKKAKALAKKQLDFYLNNGIDRVTKYPYHAIDLDNKMKLGSVNWGRGLGWFVIGLSYSIKYDKDNGNEIIPLYSNIIKNLYQIRTKNKYWPQFLGHTDDLSIDSSATLMFYFSQVIALDNENNILDDLTDALYSSISKKGFVLNASGDTFYINKYSKVKSISEVSQGLLLYILSKEK